MNKDVDESVRPWGHYEILLDTKYCKVKRIIVKPLQRLSYQYPVSYTHLRAHET